MKTKSSKLLFQAAKTGNSSVISKEVAQGASIDAYDDDGFTPLMLAVKNNNYDAARTLLEHDADPNKNRRDDLTTPLMLAAQNGNARMIKVLKTGKAALNLKNLLGQTAANIAKDPDIANLLKS